MQVAAGKIGQSPAPAGTPFEMQVNAIGRLSDPQQFGDIVVRANPASGAVVRLSDVARIELGALQYASSAYFGKDPTVVLAVFQMPGSNALDLQARVKAKMDELSQRFPKGIAYGDALRHDALRLRLHARRAGHARRGARAGRRRRLHLPAELAHDDHPDHRHPGLAHRDAGGHAWLLGFSLNMLSLLGMVLAIGLVVDDAIVVVENVERQLEAGLPPLRGDARSP